MNNLSEAVKVLNQGGIIIFPTDTAFGIGCRMDDEKAVKKLFELRKRPKTQATPVLVSSLKMASEYVKEIQPRVKKELIEKYWPGALTIVMPSVIEKVPSLVRGGDKNVGLRIPDNKTILKIIEDLGVPILGPSANFHGEKTPYSLQEVNLELIEKVDFVVKGNTKTKEASTVVDVSTNPWKIIREGAIKRSLLNLGEIKLLIDTSKTEELSVGLMVGGKRKILKESISFKKREVVLNLIEKLLKEENVSLADLSSIKVENGPGSFTGLRVGIAIANSIGTLLKIPVNNKKIGDLENAVYN